MDVHVPSPVLNADFAPDDGMLAIVSQAQAQASSPAWLRNALTGIELFRIGATSWRRAVQPRLAFLVSSEGDSAVLWALVH